MAGPGARFSIPARRSAPPAAASLGRTGSSSATAEARGASRTCSTWNASTRRGSLTARPCLGSRVLPWDVLPEVVPFYLRARSILCTQKLLDRQANIPSDLPEETRSDLARTVKRDRRPPAICMPVLLVRSPLPDLDKTQPLEQHHHLARLQDWDIGHISPRAAFGCRRTRTQERVPRPRGASR